ncbi:MAG TPA: hypothetical protein VJH95_04280 [Candidatus Nanoarchaeia archaeon]|nr:hypothetical protein [Candidatus Nanoarchaeia archaeon]
MYEIRNIGELFERASKLRREEVVIRISDKEWKEKRELDGARVFKRAALGRWRRKRSVSRDELVELLQSTGIASSVEEGRAYAGQLDGKSVNYGSLFLGGLYQLSFEKVNSEKDRERYRISKHTAN